MSPKFRTAIWSFRTDPAGAPIRTRKPFARIRPRPAADCSTTAARARASYGVTGLTVGDVFGPGRAGSIGDFGSVGRILAPAARAASPVVAYIATWAGCVLARFHGP